MFIEELQRAYDKQRLAFHGALESYRDPELFRRLLGACRRNEWVVYAKPPFSSPDTVVDYLARYTHRIAISNHRLVEMSKGTVTFTYKNYKTGEPNKTMRLEVGEFIRRFLLHVLPNGFQRIRYYGFMANCQRTQKTALCHRLLDAYPSAPLASTKEQDRLDRFTAITGFDPLQCPRCHKGRLTRFKSMPPERTHHPQPYHRARSP